MNKLPMILFCAMVLCIAPAAAVQPALGHYVGQVLTKWGPDGIHMELLATFEFVDSNGVEWIAPKGSIVDGASIPRFAWSIIGGPFEGKYRDASVIHDVACVKKNRPWQEVHRAFFDAMLASGVDAIKAKTMYAAVYHFGPRWPRTATAMASTETLAAVKQKLTNLATKDETILISATIPASTEKNCDRCEVRQPNDATFRVSAKFTPDRPSLTKGEFDQLQSSIEQNDLSLEQIESFGADGE